MAAKSIFVLGVALITWGGVFLYLLRVSAFARRLEAQLRSYENQKQESQSQPATPISLP